MSSATMRIPGRSARCEMSAWPISPFAPVIRIVLFAIVFDVERDRFGSEAIPIAIASDLESGRQFFRGGQPPHPRFFPIDHDLQAHHQRAAFTETPLSLKSDRGVAMSQEN